MEYLVYLCKISYHFIFVFLLCILGRNYSLGSKKVITVGSRRIITLNDDTNINPLFIVILSALEGVYSVICGPANEFLVDRSYYAYFYTHGGFNPANSFGIYALMEFLKKYSLDPYLFFFVTGFLYLFIILIGLNAAKLPNNIRLMTIICLGCSQCLMYGCYQIKQTLATAFVLLAIISLLNNKRILTAGFIFLAILFHEVAWIMVPLCILILFSDVKFIRYSMYVVMVLFVFGFQFLSSYMIQMVTSLIPSMQNQLNIYLNSAGNLESTGFDPLDIIKGISFYWLLYYSVKNKEVLSDKIDHFNSYLIMLVFVAVMTVLSAVSPWAWRFAELVYIPVFIYASCIFCLMGKREKYSFVMLFLFPLLFFTIRKLFMSYFIYGGIV